MFERILLPTDGSRHSAEAARAAADIAKTHGGTVQPLVAVEYSYLHGIDLTEQMSAAIRERIEQRARKALQDAEALVREAGATVNPGKVVEAESSQAILREAEEGEFHLIVMGSRGVGLDRGHERMVGSVTERVLHRAPCPVLVIRATPL
jgi:nucleotide-binding universal stress UspA family protein